MPHSLGNEKSLFPISRGIEVIFPIPRGRQFHEELGTLATPLGDISYFFGCHVTTMFHPFFLLSLEMLCKVLETQ